MFRSQATSRFEFAMVGDARALRSHILATRVRLQA